MVRFTYTKLTFHLHRTALRTDNPETELGISLGPIATGSLAAILQRPASEFLTHPSGKVPHVVNRAYEGARGGPPAFLTFSVIWEDAGLNDSLRDFEGLSLGRVLERTIIRTIGGRFVTGAEGFTSYASYEVTLDGKAGLAPPRTYRALALFGPKEPTVDRRFEVVDLVLGTNILPRVAGEDGPLGPIATRSMTSVGGASPESADDARAECATSDTQLCQGYVCCVQSGDRADCCWLAKPRTSRYPAPEIRK